MKFEVTVIRVRMARSVTLTFARREKTLHTDQ